jgi:gamma-glutamyl-gamma-aminobutyrate hydrolase PuuD
MQMKPRIGVTMNPAVHEDRLIERVNRAYVEAVVRAGGLPFLLPIQEPEVAADILANLDGLLVIGGADVDPWCYGEEPVPEVYGVDPGRDVWEVALVAAAISARLPVLGVCRGEQVINVTYGGSLVQHLPRVTDEPHRLRGREREQAHPVGIDPDSTLAAIVGDEPLGVNTLHHQAVAEVGPGLRAVAWAPDGVIEAIEDAGGRPVVGVQWHPESLIDQPRHGLLFLWLTRTGASGRPGVEVPEDFAPAPVTLVDDVA